MKPKKRIPFFNQIIVIIVLIGIFLLIKLGVPVYLEYRSIDILDQHIELDGETAFYSTPIVSGNNILGEEIIAKENAIIIENNLHDFKVQIKSINKDSIELIMTNREGKEELFTIKNKLNKEFEIPETNGYIIKINNYFKSKKALFLTVQYAPDSIETFK